MGERAPYSAVRAPLRQTERRVCQSRNQYVLDLSRREVRVYELQERLVTDFPDLLLENCSGGGARFDPGMLYYSP